eukprot:CAMPEP_0197251816 /NCGR_PEP_ID=MMETSP1429-20130617/58695_1 /TAXON_ID=49237 /ORGANISM="Chaetoceros  sp., Strain UNC1202" /LENGTH=70 /DNA_ID=CAMNT_0042714009 /DNA_START=96 /DNA_END=308 /DNA_ORIENTATION=+
MTLQTGSVHIIQDDAQVQQIVNEANKFNRTIIQESTTTGIDNAVVKEKGGVVVDIKLDPLNAINTFHIPA